jgi:hypothetical protein
MSKVAIVKIWKQLVRIKVTQLFNVVILSTWVEIVVAPNTNFVRGRILIGFVTNLGHGSGGVLAKRNLNRSSRIPVAIIRIVATP